jgi:hypothetical protein
MGVMAGARSHWFITPLPFHRLFSDFPSPIHTLLLTKRIRRRVRKRAPINRIDALFFSPLTARARGKRTHWAGRSKETNWWATRRTAFSHGPLFRVDCNWLAGWERGLSWQKGAPELDQISIKQISGLGYQTKRCAHSAWSIECGCLCSTLLEFQLRPSFASPEILRIPSRVRSA